MFVFSLSRALSIERYVRNLRFNYYWNNEEVDLLDVIMVNFLAANLFTAKSCFCPLSRGKNRLVVANLHHHNMVICIMPYTTTRLVS